MLYDYSDVVKCRIHLFSARYIKVLRFYSVVIERERKCRL